MHNALGAFASSSRAAANMRRGNADRDPCKVSLAADFLRRYSGEDVTFFGLVEVWESLSSFTLRIILPEGLVPGVTRAPDNIVPHVAVDAGTHHLVWNIAGRIREGSQYEFQVDARVAPNHQDQLLKSRALVTAELGVQRSFGESQARTFSAEETVTIAVSAKGQYLKHLPALYDSDKLMARFLMLFESFWKPIEGQIAHLSYYFDPRFTPSDFLSWLASWLDLVLDEHWPEARRRLLVRSAAELYRQRGTRRGLARYLEIFTGEQAEIIEHRANNFRLGPEGRLGPGIALGTLNVPHTFTVILSAPSASELEADEESARRETEHRRIIESIIQAEKPAHTGYTLRFESR